MEAMALVGIHYAMGSNTSGQSQRKINMHEFFERSLCARVWLNVQRSNTSKREMDFFKERRQSLFFQWGLSGRGVLSQPRDIAGRFSRPDNHQEESGSTSVAQGKKRKLDLYSEVFVNFYPQTYKV